jgi:diguanylate cyclase (GGDEF)-like protein/PAS domain S-box-containing protein
MTSESLDITEFHWLLDMLQTIDVGLVVMDKEFNILVWNSFMENHSGLSPDNVKNKSIFDVFKEIPEEWLRKKARSVFLLKNRTFTTWEQRPYVFKFKNYRPITGTARYMYQNTTIIPLGSTDSTVNHICMTIYDVTDAAVNKLALKEANASLQALSRTDQLTQLNNRGFWEESMKTEFQRCSRYDNISSLVLLDIDKFKEVNDEHGHQVGDDVLKELSKIITDSLRTTDNAGRYGGEEFGIILPDTSGAEALVFTERLRQKVEACTVLSDNKEIKFTISVGISEISPLVNNYVQWLKQSDVALYHCKDNGRNQSAVYHSDMGT